MSSGRDMFADRGPGGERFGTFSVVVLKDDVRFCYLKFSPGTDRRVAISTCGGVSKKFCHDPPPFRRVSLAALRLKPPHS